MRINEQEYREWAKQQVAQERRAGAEETAAKLVEKTQRRPLNEHDQALAKSLAGMTQGDKPGAVRPKLKEPPKGLKWGGVVSTQRDTEHCACGLRFIDHTPEKLIGISCPLILGPPKKEKRL